MLNAANRSMQCVIGKIVAAQLHLAQPLHLPLVSEPGGTWLWRLQHRWGRKCAALNQPTVHRVGQCCRQSICNRPVCRPCNHFQVIERKRNCCGAGGVNLTAAKMGEAVQRLGRRRMQYGLQASTTNPIFPPPPPPPPPPSLA